jgi:hypothetical protein
MNYLTHETITNSELEFIAEQETNIKIVVNENIPKIELISHNIEPLVQGQAIEVPLWIALHLKKLKVCKIVMPEWMKIEKLEDILIKSGSDFTFVPFHFIEIASLLLKL